MLILLDPMVLPSNPYIDLYKSSLTEKGCKFISFNWKNIWRFRKTAKVVALNWPEWSFNSRFHVIAIYRLLVFMLKLLSCKFLNIKVVWTVHNLEPHVKKLNGRFYDIAYYILIKIVDGFIFLTDASKSDAYEKFSGLNRKLFTVSGIGPYPKLSVSNNCVDIFKKNNNIDARKTIIYFGIIQEYKGVDTLMIEYNKLSEEIKEQYQLVVCGSVPDQKLLSKLASISENTPANIKTIFNYVTNEELACLLHIGRLFVFPFKVVSNTSSVVTALTHGKHVLAPFIGSIKDYAEIPNSLLHTYNNSLSAKIIEDTIQTIDKSDSFENFLSFPFPTWNIIADKTFIFYHSLTK